MAVKTGLDTTAQNLPDAIDELKADVDSNTASVAVLDNHVTITKDPSGFTDPANVIVTYDDTARTITLTGTVEAYYLGEQITALVSGWVSDPHTASPTSTLFLKYNGVGFSWSYTPWNFSETQIAYVCVNAAGVCFAQREPHGLMSWQSHKEFHDQIGTYRESGGDIGGIVEGSTTAADRRPTFSECLVNDEDLPSTIPVFSTKTDYTQLYLTATETTNLLKAQADIVPLSTARPYWNEFTGGAFQQTLMTNNSYMDLWVIAIPTTADSFSSGVRFTFIQGQSNSTDIDEIRALSFFDLNLGGFINLSPEFVVIEKFVLQYTGGNWNIVETTRIEGSRALQVSGPSGSFLTSVTSDTSLTGTGTAISPLSVSAPEEIITSNDGSTTLSPTSTIKQVINGSGADHSIAFGTSTAYDDEHEFYIKNDNDYAVTVEGVTVPTGKTYIFTLKDNTTDTWVYRVLDDKLPIDTRVQTPYIGTKAVVIGDSNTEGLPGLDRYNYTRKLTELTGIPFINYGVGGDEASDILLQVPDAVAITDKIVIVLAGTNDALNSVAIATTKANLISIKEDIVAAGAVPVFLEIPPINTALLSNVQAVNNVINNELGANHVVKIFDFFYDSADDQIYDIWQNADALHFNVAGSDKLGEIVYSQIYDLLQTPDFVAGPDLTAQSTANQIEIVGGAGHSNDFPSWLYQIELGTWTTGVTAPDGTSTAFGMVATTNSAQHWVGLELTGDITRLYTGGWIKEGVSEFVRIRNNITTKDTWLHISTGWLSADSDLEDSISVVADPFGDGWTHVWFKSTTIQANTSVSIYAARTGEEADGLTFVGDGTLPELYLWNWFQGYDALPVFDALIDQSEMNRKKEIGLRQRVESLDWHTRQNDIEYIEDAETFGLRIEKTYTGASATQTLKSSSNAASIKKCTGFIQNSTTTQLPVGQYKSTTEFSAVDLDIATGDLTLNVGSDYDDIDDSCDVTIEYEK